MRFTVSRTSLGWDGDGRPCEHAVRGTYIETERRHPSATTWTDDHRRRWYAEGVNHREEDGDFVREQIIPAWFIEISTLDALAAFVGSHGDVVITGGRSDFPGLGIEIYDDYRE